MGKKRDQEAVGGTGREPSTDITQRRDFRVAEVSPFLHPPLPAPGQSAICGSVLEHNQRTPALSDGPFL